MVHLLSNFDNYWKSCGLKVTFWIDSLILLNRKKLQIDEHFYRHKGTITFAVLLVPLTQRRNIRAKNRLQLRCRYCVLDIPKLQVTIRILIVETGDKATFRQIKVIGLLLTLQCDLSQYIRRFVLLLCNTGNLK